MGVENSYVLVLNSGWLPIGVKRLKEAISAVYENKDWQLVQIDYLEDEPFIQPIGWNDWIDLDIPKYCKGIHTIRGIIRQPTVIIAKTYSKVNFRKLRPNKRGIYDRDRGVCQYTGKKLTRTNCSIDHRVQNQEEVRTLGKIWYYAIKRSTIKKALSYLVSFIYK